jgi:hypothetical protein
MHEIVLENHLANGTYTLGFVMRRSVSLREGHAAGKGSRVGEDNRINRVSRISRGWQVAGL